jgi:hypothetical protein
MDVCVIASKPVEAVPTAAAHQTGKTVATIPRESLPIELSGNAPPQGATLTKRRIAGIEEGSSLSGAGPMGIVRMKRQAIETRDLPGLVASPAAAREEVEMMMMTDMTGRADAGHETGTMTSRV